jgi:hypothetical protein
LPRIDQRKQDAARLRTAIDPDMIGGLPDDQRMPHGKTLASARSPITFIMKLGRREALSESAWAGAAGQLPKG